MKLHDRSTDTSRTPTRLDDSSELTRYLRQESHWRGGRLRSQAFMPPKDSVVISVFLVDGLTSMQRWHHGDAYVGFVASARADFHVGTCRAYDLDVMFDDKPPRHANVGFFPTDKAARNNVAQRLASHATLVERETG